MIDHNHIFQSVDGVEGCPACARINPLHMTRFYALGAHREGAWR